MSTATPAVGGKKAAVWYSVDPRDGKPANYTEATAAQIEAAYQACVVDKVANRQFVNIAVDKLRFVVDVVALLQYSSASGGTREVYRQAPDEEEDAEELEEEEDIHDEALAALPDNALWYRAKKKPQVHLVAPEVRVLTQVLRHFHFDVALGLRMFHKIRLVGKRSDLHGKEVGFVRGLRTMAKGGLPPKGNPNCKAALTGSAAVGIASEAELGMMGLVPTQNTLRQLDRCVLNAMAEGWKDVVVAALPYLEDINDTHDGAKGGFLLAAVEYRLPTELMVEILKQSTCIHDLADSKGMNILHWACRDGLVDLTNRLSLEYGATIPHDAPTVQGVTPLLFAACMGKIEIVELMCRFSDVNPHAVDTNGWSAIHYAAKYGFMPVIQFYYDNYGTSTDFWKPQQDGLTCLHFAVSEQQEEVVAFLLSLPEVKKCINRGDVNQWTVLHYACKRANSNIVKKLLQCPEVDPTAIEKEGCSPLMFAASTTSFECVEELLKDDRVRSLINEVDVAKWSALHYASRHGTVAAVRAIMAVKDVDVNLVQEAGCTALHFSVCHGQKEVTHMILEHPDVKLDLPDSKGWTALHYAAKSGSVELVRSFGKKADADLNILDSAGCSALHRAAACEHLDVVEELLSFKDVDGKYRVDVTLQDSSKWTALHYAARYDGPESCVLLINAGADVNVKAASDVTPIHYASCYGQAESARILLEAGANPNDVDTNGWNALHYAVAHGYTQIMRLLFEKTEGAYLEAEFNKNLPEFENTSPDKKKKPAVVGPKNSALPVGHAAGATAAPGTDLIGTKRTAEEEEARKVVVRALKTQKAIDAEAEGKSLKTYISSLDSTISVKATGMTILHYAVTNGEKEGGSKAIDELLTYLDDATLVKLSNCKDIHGATAFMSAARKGYTTAVERLLGCADTDVGPENKNVHALHAAVAENRVDVVKILCKSPRIQPQIEERDTKGWTALLMASRYGYSEMITCLLEVPGVNVNAYQIDYCTPLHFATCHGFPEVVKQLLAVPGIEKNCTDVDNVTPLLYALKGKTILTDPKMPEVVELLLDDPEVDKTVVDTTGWGVVHGIVRLGKIHLLEKLLNDPATPHYQPGDDEEEEVVVVAPEVVSDGTPTPEAEGGGNSPTTTMTTKKKKKTLKKKSININQLTYKKVAPLHGAVVGGQTEMVKYLVSLPTTDKNIRDIDGLTSLHYACEDGFTDLVELLLDLPDVDKATFDRSGWSPFYSACKAGRTQVVKILLDHKARVLSKAAFTNTSFATREMASTVNLNQSNKAGIVPLHMACFYADISLVENLLYDNTPEAQDIIKRGKKFYSPEKHKKVLWNYDIDIGATDRFGWNCFHYALSFLGPNSAATMTVAQQQSFVKLVCEVVTQHPKFELSLLTGVTSKPLTNLTHIIDAVEKPWPRKMLKKTWEEEQKKKKEGAEMKKHEEEEEEARKTLVEEEAASQSEIDTELSEERKKLPPIPERLPPSVSSSSVPSPPPLAQQEDDLSQAPEVVEKKSSVHIDPMTSGNSEADLAPCVEGNNENLDVAPTAGGSSDATVTNTETTSTTVEKEEEGADEHKEDVDTVEEKECENDRDSAKSSSNKDGDEDTPTTALQKKDDEAPPGWETQLVPKKTEPLEEEEFITLEVDGDTDFLDTNPAVHTDWRCRAGTPLAFASWAHFSFDFVPGLDAARPRACCPSGHTLVPGSLPDCSCDKCGTEWLELAAPGKPVSGECRPCDFDLCEKCFTAEKEEVELKKKGADEQKYDEQ